MIYMTLNQFLVINVSLYIVSDMNARYAHVSPISDIRKIPIRYDPNIQYLKPWIYEHFYIMRPPHNMDYTNALPRTCMWGSGG